MSRAGNFVMLLIVSMLSLDAVAGDMLSSICSRSGGKLHQNQRISYYTATNVWPAGGQGSLPAVQISFGRTTLGIYSDAITNGGGSLGVQDFARTMALLGEPVDICERSGYLIGLENTRSFE